MDQAPGGDVPAHDLARALVRVHATRMCDRVGRQLPLPVGPDLLLLRPCPLLVHHGLGAASNSTGKIGRRYKDQFGKNISSIDKPKLWQIIIVITDNLGQIW